MEKLEEGVGSASGRERCLITMVALPPSFRDPMPELVEEVEHKGKLARCGLFLGDGGFQHDNSFAVGVDVKIYASQPLHELSGRPELRFTRNE